MSKADLKMQMTFTLTSEDGDLIEAVNSFRGRARGRRLKDLVWMGLLAERMGFRLDRRDESAEFDLLMSQKTAARMLGGGANTPPPAPPPPPPPTQASPALSRVAAQFLDPDDD